ncbi:hypothetical protein [Paenibacillus sp. FSL P2-0173]|uniref:hypothetical protein n=1 Tax=Paenibacillus sp. FSL P2-0173 TaxID=2921627 RepID=UPI0030F646CB
MTVALRPLDSTEQSPETIPVIFNVHDTSWTNAYGNQSFYMPTYELLLPQSNDNENTSPITFRIFGDPGPAGDESKLSARINLKVKIGSPSHAGPGMSPVPMKLSIGFHIPYLDTDGTVLSHFVQPQIEEHADSVFISVFLSGQWVALSYKR